MIKMYNFDEINRQTRNKCLLSTDGFRGYIFHAVENIKFPHKNEELTMFLVNNAGILLKAENMFIQNADCFIKVEFGLSKRCIIGRTEKDLGSCE